MHKNQISGIESFRQALERLIEAGIDHPNPRGRRQANRGIEVLDAVDASRDELEIDDLENDASRLPTRLPQRPRW